MRVLYVAKHHQGNRLSNDDEGAVTYAFRSLGHEVVEIQQSRGSRVQKLDGDLILFHKWLDPTSLVRVGNRIPKVFWYFDLVDPAPFRDVLLNRTCLGRVEWMRTVIPLVDFGFCTDGDWVAQDKTGKLVWLCQGFDERRFNYPSAQKDKDLDLLFVGSSSICGRGRVEFLEFLEGFYGDRFFQVRKVYGPALHNLVTRATVLVAPDSPVTDRYWSNRVYNNVGMGGFLLHPWSEGLSWQYIPTTELMYYNDREHLRYLIDWYLEDASGRQRVAAAALERTKKDHLYVNRVATMLSVLRQRGIVK